MKKKKKCDNHPAREAAVERHYIFMCWECYLGAARFRRRYGEDYYKKVDAAMDQGEKLE